jgi:hypothetical protein
MDYTHDNLFQENMRVLLLSTCWRINEDGCPRQWCRLDKKGSRVMKACLRDPVHIGTIGKIPPWDVPLNMISIMARSLIKRNKGWNSINHCCLEQFYSSIHKRLLMSIVEQRRSLVSYKDSVLVGKDSLYPIYSLQMTTSSSHKVIVWVYVLPKKPFILIVKPRDRR